jgi:uncharacterized damage-inducible protein DinB
VYPKTFIAPCLSIIALATTALAQTADPQTQALKQFYEFNKRVAIASAEKMPAEHYGFKPSADVRSFAELISHIADGNYLTCSSAKGEPSPNGSELQKTEKTVKTKAEVIKALQASFNYCDAVFDKLTDATLKETVKFFGKEQTKALIITLNVHHGGEHYGNSATYLRMKGLVPPSSEPAPAPAK